MSGGGDTPSPDFGLRTDFYTFAPETLAQELPQFEILREVGKGSMGIVYEARVRATGARIALKVLPPSLTLTERALARFLREGRIMARVRHPDIVAFYDQGTQGRLHWFAMEFVDGVTLQQRLQVGPLPVRKACAIAARVARALQYAHDQGVVHRDVKPGNLMLRDPGDSGNGDNGGNGGGNGDDAPRVAITDFGLARETGTGSMTESGALVGTPMYMAPEQVLGGSALANTLGDVYSLGATLYALVTGQPPFDGPTAQSVLKAVLDHDPPPPRRRRADLPAAVDAIVQKAMARHPARRYGSALELAEDLERFLRGERVLARAPGPLVRCGRWCARRPLVVGLGGAALALATGALLLAHERRRDAIEQGLADAERLLATAATARDEQGSPRSADERRDLLLAAAGAATAALERDGTFAPARVVRARVHNRLGQHQDAVFDLDAAERLGGAATAEILQLRIDALRQLGDAAAVRRLQQDLTSLLHLDPGTHTRTLVAEHLLDLAETAALAERAEALARARDVLAPIGADEPRAAVSRARVLELEGDAAAALAAMRAARARHEGNLYVHLQAAAMFDRQGLAEESAREHGMARLLEPGAPAAASPAPVDLEGLGKFLGEVDRLMQALDQKPGNAPDGRKD
ncbi:MAG: serine/threonine protein kinase [Planctomycetes bacterium]|nr:serine/threonine protein kinase [Planctomycetota bacterium]